MSRYEYTFTIFTSTFNRAHTLYRVYEGLKNQTFKDFEWLIIDDGSTDNTQEIVSAWAKEASFVIRYYRQENQGKHIAYNWAVLLAQGKLFVSLDSDDTCVPNALERLNYHWEFIPEEERIYFCGVVCLCIDEDGHIVGERFPQENMNSNHQEMKYKYRNSAERWGCHVTDILKQFPFPESKDIHFIMESFIWCQISKLYKTRCINEPLRVYYSNDIGTNRLTTHDNSKHAMGNMMAYQLFLNIDIMWLRYAPVQFFWYAVHYTRFSFHLHKTLTTQLKELKPITAKCLWLIALPIGLLVFWRDLRRK